MQHSAGNVALPKIRPSRRPELLRVAGGASLKTPSHRKRTLWHRTPSLLQSDQRRTTIGRMKSEVAYDPMDAATYMMLRSKEQLLRDTPRRDNDSLQWRVEQRGVQLWVILCRYGEPSDILFEYPRGYFESLKDDELAKMFMGLPLR